MEARDVAYILLGVILIASFITIFFFTYVSKVEGQVVKNQIADIVGNLTDNTKLIFTPTQLNIISAVLEQYLTMPDMRETDDRAEQNNREIQQNAIKIFGIGIAIGVFILLLMWYKYKFSMAELLKYSFITLFMIGITEYLFVTIVSKNYIIVDPNYVRYLIVRNLRDYANTK